MASLKTIFKLASSPAYWQLQPGIRHSKFNLTAGRIDLRIMINPACRPGMKNDEVETTSKIIILYSKFVIQI